MMINDGKSLMVDKGYGLANSAANSQIQKIPFFAQTTVSVNGTTDAATNFSIDSFMKLKEISKDNEGDLKTLLFGQARFSKASSSDGSTTNLGLGIRHRPNDESMLGANAFVDYRMTNYSDAHSRLGLGGEYFWKDFEFRNNWYMAITDEKDVTVKGTSYKERVVPGWDVELGYRLPNNPQLAFFVRGLGFTWLTLLVVIAEFQIVISRFVYSYEQAFMGDLVRMWYAALFLFASSYALVNEGHVRVDVLYSRFKDRAKAYSNAVGCLLLGIPLCWIILMTGMWGKGSSLNSPLLSFEVYQQGFGMYTKYLMVGFLIVFAVCMLVQFTGYFLYNVAQLLGEEVSNEKYLQRSNS